MRHGTRAFLARRDIVTGQFVAPFCGPTRTEKDFFVRVRAAMATDPEACRRHFVCGNLTLHQSESLVHFVTSVSGIEEDPGVKGKRGILASMPGRAAFVREPSHPVVFHSTPTHRSWLNQMDT